MSGDDLRDRASRAMAELAALVTERGLPGREIQDVLENLVASRLLEQDRCLHLIYPQAFETAPRFCRRSREGRSDFCRIHTPPRDEPVPVYIPVYRGGRMSTYLARREEWIKIGRSTNVKTRMRELSRARGTARPADMSDGPVALLHVFEGEDCENYLHLRWHGYRVGVTEWFRYEGAFAAWVDSLDTH